MANVDLSTGKLNIPITLATLTGPNGFGESLTIKYATLGLLDKIKTWNEDAPTGVLGLGWYMDTPYILRMGNGSINDNFFLNDTPLFLKSKTNGGNGDILEFETAAHSLNKIIYEPKIETWTLTDANGVKYVYGTMDNNGTAIEWGVRWVAQDNQSPKVWIGSSVETTNQERYALVWNLSYKQNSYGQRVNYGYIVIGQTIGLRGARPEGKQYTMAAYLSSIKVQNGESITLTYLEKYIWEYPTNRLADFWTNAYQDRIAKYYLDHIKVFGSNNILQSTIEMTYGLLYENMDESVRDWKDRPKMDKRILTAISYKTPEGLLYEPPQEFEYWGHTKENADGFKGIIKRDNILKLTDEILSSAKPVPYPGDNTQSWNPLFGHLKNSKSPGGATTWYSYNEIGINYRNVWNDGSWDKFWQNSLQSGEIGYPDGGNKNTSLWTNPQPYFGPDGYVALVWEHKLEGNKYRAQLYISLYEWLGKWTEIKYSTDNEGPIFDVAGYNSKQFPQLNIFVFDSGKFALLKMQMYGAKSGNIILFHRDAYMPGKWNITSYTSDKGFDYTYLPPYYNNLPRADFGENTFAIVDPKNSKLYRYVLNNNAWSALTAFNIAADPVPGTSFSALGMLSNHIFVTSSKLLGDDKTKLSVLTYYWLFQFDPINMTWQERISKAQWEGDFMEEMPESVKKKHFNYALIDKSSGFLVLQGFVQTDHTDNIYHVVARPVAISWSDDFTQVNLQKIYSRFNIENNKDNKLFWGYWASKDNYMSSTHYGQLQISDSLCITSGNAPKKYVTRFIGGSKANDGRQNLGWYSTDDMKNNSDGSDLWARLATGGTTVAISNGESEFNYGYLLYQYGAIYEQWSAQTNVDMGTNQDWQAIFDIIDQIFGWVSLVASFIPFSDIAGFISQGLATAVRITEGVLFAESFIQSGVEYLVLKEALSGRRDEIQMGQNYLIVGTKHTRKLNSYVRYWNTDNLSYAWKSLGGIKPDNLVYPRGSNFTFGLVADTYSYNNNFAIFGYTVEGDSNFVLRSDQVIIFRNGITQKAMRMPDAKIPTWDTGSNYPLLLSNCNNIKDGCHAPLSNSNSSSDHNYLMSAPWGAIVGYLPSSHWGTTLTQSDIDKAYFLVLLKVYNEYITGHVTDYVVDKITTGDGYQWHNTFYLYMPKNAYYQNTRGTILYNQTRIATGGKTFQDAAGKFGWIENYFYTGKPNYDPLSYDNGFDFDPANYNDNKYVENNKDQTNAGQYLNLLIGRQYAQVTYRPQKEGEIENGYEMAQKYFFYKVFEKNMLDNQGNSVGTRKLRGILTTLAAQFTAGDDATYTYSGKRIVNDGYYGKGKDDYGKVTLAEQYNYYDVKGFYDLFTNGTGQETALLLSQTTYNYDHNKLRQALNTAYKRAFQIKDYIDTEDPQKVNVFINQNRLNIIAQTLARQNNDINKAGSLWQVISSSVTTWQKEQNTGLWSPYSSYAWKGEEKLISGLDFPAWVNPDMDIKNWAFAGKPTLMQKGIVLQTLSNVKTYDTYSKTAINTPASIVYDKNKMHTLATFNNAAVYSNIAMYSGFEQYEDLSNWRAYFSGFPTDGCPIDPNFIALTDSYTGKRCLSVMPPGNVGSGSILWESTLSLSLNVLPEKIVVSFFYKANGTPNNDLTVLIVLANITGEPNKAFQLSKNATEWTYFAAVVSIAELIEKNTGSTKLALSIKSSANSNYFIDNVCIMPVGASVGIHVLDQDTELPIASIDSNGLTTRTIYNIKREIIAKVQGRGKGMDNENRNHQQPLSLSWNYYSRNGNQGNFSDVNPNNVLSMVARNGGGYFDFRVDGNTQGWKGGTIKDQTLWLVSGQTASYPLPAQSQYENGFALRVQIKPTTSNNLQKMRISMGDIIVEWDATFEKSGGYNLFLGNNPKPSLSVKGEFATDWLLVTINGKFYFYADTRYIFLAAEQPTQGNFTINVLNTSDPNKQIGFKDIIIINDPILSAQFTDGMGDIRQIQTVAELTSNNAATSTENIEPE